MTPETVKFRWVNGYDASEQDWDRIESILAARGWVSLNRNTSRILVAESGGELVGFHVFQLIGLCGPLYVRPSSRGTKVAQDLADQMLDFLAEANARGWIVVADSRHAAKLCEERGMSEVNSPVYVMGNPGSVEV